MMRKNDSGVWNLVVAVAIYMSPLQIGPAISTNLICKMLTPGLRVYYWIPLMFHLHPPVLFAGDRITESIVPSPGPTVYHITTLIPLPQRI